MEETVDGSEKEEGEEGQEASDVLGGIAREGGRAGPPIPVAISQPVMILTPEQQASFSKYLSSIGLISNAVGLFDPSTPAVGKAISGANAISQGSNLSGSLGGPSLPGAVGKGIGTAAGVAGAGYGISKIAGDPNLSNTQKAGASAGEVANAVASLYVPYYGLGVAARGINQAASRSGSPQIRAIGKGNSFPAVPVEGLLDVISGKMSPRASGNAMVSKLYDAPVLGGAFKSVGQAFGLGTEPTTGTKFRRELSSLTDRIPQLKGLDTKQYNIDPEKYNSFSQASRDKAMVLGTALAGRTKDARKNPNAYAGQVSSMLLNKYGDGVLDLAKQLGL